MSDLKLSATIKKVVDGSSSSSEDSMIVDITDKIIVSGVQEIGFSYEAIEKGPEMSTIDFVVLKTVETLATSFLMSIDGTYDIMITSIFNGFFFVFFLDSSADLYLRASSGTVNVQYLLIGE